MWRSSWLRADDGIVANADMPGPTYTGFQRFMDPEQLRARLGGADVEAGEVPPGWKTIRQGAATTVCAATAPGLAGTGGRHLEDCALAEVVDEAGDRRHGVARYALEPGNAERLWDVSRALLRG